MKILIAIAAAAMCAGCGIRSIELVRNADGYDFEYTNIGLKTDVTRIEIEKSTNGIVRCIICRGFRTAHCFSSGKLQY